MGISQAQLDEYKTKQLTAFPLRMSATSKQDKWKKGVHAPSGWQTCTHETEWAVAANHNAVGLLTGEPSDIFVLDIDDVEQWRTWLQQNRQTDKWAAIEATTVTVRTASGGLHFYFRLTEELMRLKGRAHCFGGDWRFDSRITGNFVFAPPTALKTKHVDWQYTWIRSLFDHPLTDIPDFLARALLMPGQGAASPDGKKARKPAPSRPVIPSAGTSEASPSDITEVRIGTDKGKLFEQIVQLLGSQRFTNYNDWIGVGWKIKELGIPDHEALAIFQIGSRKVPHKFDEVDDWHAKWHSFKVDEGEETARKAEFVLKAWAREDDPDGLRALMERQPTPLIAEDRSYACVKLDFEKSWFRLLNPPVFAFLDTSKGSPELLFRKKAELRHIAELKTFEEAQQSNNGSKSVQDNNFLERWLKDPEQRTYAGIDFRPPPLVCPDNIYNTFPGLRAATLPPVEGARDLSPILDLIYDLCDRDRAARDYIVHYMADLVQKPGRLPGTGLIMRSRQGRGKNTLWGSFFAQKILGESLYYSSANPDHFFGRFANGMINKLLCNFNEVQCDQTSRIMGLVKEAITEPFINYERKGMVVKVHNFARQVWFSNELMPICISADDRRWVAVQASDRMPDTGTPEHADYFQRIHDWVADDSNVRAFYDMLMATELSGWNAERDRPRTSFYTDLQQLSLNRVDQWLVEQVENDTLPEEMLSRALADAVNADRPGKPFSSILVKKLLDGYSNSGVVHNSGMRIGTKTGNGYSFSADLLRENLIKKSYISPKPLGPPAFVDSGSEEDN